MLLESYVLLIKENNVNLWFKGNKIKSTIILGRRVKRHFKYIHICQNKVTKGPS